MPDAPVSIGKGMDKFQFTQDSNIHTRTETQRDVTTYTPLRSLSSSKTSRHVKTEHNKDIFGTGDSIRTDTEPLGRVAGATLPNDFYILKLQILILYVLKNTFLSTFRPSSSMVCLPVTTSREDQGCFKNRFKVKS